jgi:hypothetical protein
MFSTASLLLILVAGLHSLGGFAPPRDAADAGLRQTMSNHTFDPGLGMRPSARGVFLSIWFTMSILLALWGVMNLCAARLASQQLVRCYALLSSTFCLALVALYWHYQLPPPLLSLAVVGVLFLLSLARPAQEG